MNRQIADQKTSIHYTIQGTYYLTGLALPAEENIISAYGMQVASGDLCQRQKYDRGGSRDQRQRRYFKEHHRNLYYYLLTTCKLNSHIADIDWQAEEMFSQLVKQMAEREGITEELKAQDQMAWVGRMNNIRNRATEIVNAKIIFLFRSICKGGQKGDGGSLVLSSFPLPDLSEWRNIYNQKS